jgi:predicted MFS family arabinose efflux permease
MLGGAGSFVITGPLSWGLALSSPHRAGKIMAWMGTATYASYAIGAPIGTILYEQTGFVAIALATLVVPLAALVIVTSLRGVPPLLTEKPTVGRVLAAVGLPGLGLALCSIGSAAVTAFVALLFVARGWAPVWPAFTAFASVFIVVRIFLGHPLSDRVGGVRVALVFLVIEALGQAVTWLADEAPMAMAGAAMTGFGYSQVFPGFGVEAVRRASQQSRGFAVGIYTAFLDLAIGLSSPALGFIASGAGLSSVFLAGAMVTLSAAGGCHSTAVVRAHRHTLRRYDAGQACVLKPWRVPLLRAMHRPALGPDARWKRQIGRVGRPWDEVVMRHGRGPEAQTTRGTPAYATTTRPSARNFGTISITFSRAA